MSVIYCLILLLSLFKKSSLVYCSKNSFLIINDKFSNLFGNVAKHSWTVMTGLKLVSEQLQTTLIKCDASKEWIILAIISFTCFC